MEKSIITFENETKDKKCVIETTYDKAKEQMQIKFNFIPELKPPQEPELYAIMAMSYIRILNEGDKK